MDRDRNENVIDPVEEVGPSTGNSDTGESGQQRAREEAVEHAKLRREEQGTETRKNNNLGVN